MEKIIGFVQGILNNIMKSMIVGIVIIIITIVITLIYKKYRNIQREKSRVDPVLLKEKQKLHDEYMGKRNNHKRIDNLKELAQENGIEEVNKMDEVIGNKVGSGIKKFLDKDKDK